MTKKMLTVAAILIFSCINLISQNNSKNDVIGYVGSEEITFEKLENAFKKNMNNRDSDFKTISKDSLYEFLDLYINYRLKVNDALRLGLQNDSSVISDIEQNRKILAESFYYDHTLTKPNVRKFLERRDTEYKIAIILLTNTQGTVTDTLTAYNKAKEALARVKSGESFAAVAKDVSNDRQSADNNGIIPNYITSGKVQRPIEDAIYLMDEGELYPEIVSTKYGYFIIKVVEKTPRKLVKARHILLNMKMESDSAKIIQKADSLIAVLNAGADFDKIAREHSDDKVTAEDGGYLGSWYSRSTGLQTTGRPLVQEFEKALYDLKDGEISEKVFTEFGVHIIKREASRDYIAEEEENDLRNMYRRLYYDEDKVLLLDSLSKSLGFKLNEVNLERFVAQLDATSNSLDKEWESQITEDLRKSELFVLDGKKFTVADMIEKMNKAPQLRGISTTMEGVMKAIYLVKEPIVFEAATKNLEQNNPDFKNLINEFRDGILLFKVEAMEVWEKLDFDSSKARIYYEKQNKKYYTDKKYDVQEIFMLNKNEANKVYKSLQDGEDFDKMATDKTQRSGMREKNGKRGELSVKRDDLAKALESKGVKKGEITEPISLDNGFAIVKVLDIIEPREKTFEESISDIAPEYQDMKQKELTNEWLERIKKEIKVSVDKNKIEQLRKSSK